MSDELQNGVPPVPSGTGEGQPETTAEEQQPTPAKINLDDIPEFRNWKSESDRRIAAERRAREEAERKAEAERQLREYQLKQVQEIDPDAAKVLLAGAEIKQLKLDNESLQYKVWVNDALSWGRDNGLDTQSEEFQAAIAAGDSDRLDQLAYERQQADRLAKLVDQQVAERLKAAGVSPQQPAQPAPAQPGQPAQPQRPPAAVLPPSGGSAAPQGQDGRTPEQQRIWDGAMEELNTARNAGRAIDRPSVFAKWRRIAREENVEPPF